MKLYYDARPSSSGMVGAPYGAAAGMLHQRITKPRTHRVAPDETMLSIARRYNLNPATFLALNPQKVVLAGGRRSVIPVVQGEVVFVSGLVRGARAAMLGDNMLGVEAALPGTCPDGWSWSLSELGCVWDKAGQPCAPFQGPDGATYQQIGGVYTKEGGCSGGQLTQIAPAPGGGTPGGGGGGAPCVYVDENGVKFEGTTDAAGNCVNLGPPIYPNQGGPTTTAGCVQKWGAGYVYSPMADGGKGACIQCGPNTTINAQDGMCDCLPGYVPVGGQGQGCKPAGGGGGPPPPPPSCPAGQTWNGSACVPSGGGGPPPPPSCPAGQVWNGSACAPPTTPAAGKKEESSVVPWVVAALAALAGGVVIAKNMKKKKAA